MSNAQPGGYGHHSKPADVELDCNMKTSEIAEALQMLVFANSGSRRTVGLDRETCRFIVDRLRQPA